MRACALKVSKIERWKTTNHAVESLIEENNKFTIYNKSTGIAAARGTIPSSYQAFKVLRLSADLSSSGTQFQICGPKNLRLFVPKVT